MMKIISARILQVSFLVSSLLWPLASCSSATIVDLSLDLETSRFMNSTGAQRIRTTGYTTRAIRRAVVLEHGKIVADYVRDVKLGAEPFDIVDPDEPFEQWSVTKSWTNLLIGLLVDANILSLDETLGSIWPNDFTWFGVRDAEERKEVTIRSLLTMTSGMVDPQWYALGNPLDQGTGGGANLAHTLSYLDIGDEPDEFSYLLMSNILSYVILEKTGLTPREFASQTVLPALGIRDSEIGWWQNRDNVEYSFHGLKLTALQMAKLGQLYLQQGQVGNGQQLVSSSWIHDSTSHLVHEETTEGAYYGYLFWLADGHWVGNPSVEEFYCAVGVGGQTICVHPGLDRVSVQQRDYANFPYYADEYVIAGAAFDPSVSFDDELPAQHRSLRGRGNGGTH